VVGVVALLGSACATSNFAPTDAEAVEQALTASGATICEQGDAPSHFEGEVSATWYLLATDCGSGEGLVAGVARFDSEGNRNAAFSDTRYRMRRLSNHAVLTFGDTLVVLTQIRDAALLEDVASSLRDAGAK
jgi:hypothetical protein